MIQYKTAVSCVCEWSFKNKKAKHLSVCFKASQGDIGGYEPQCDRTRFHLKDLIWSLGAEDEYALRDKVYPILFVYKLDIMKPVLCMSFQCVLNKMSSWAFCVLLSASCFNYFSCSSGTFYCWFTSCFYSSACVSFLHFFRSSVCPPDVLISFFPY